MTLDELHDLVKQGFQRVDERFEWIETEFASQLKRELASELKTELATELKATLKAELVTEIRAEGETTRRHFDVMVEKVEAAVRIVSEGTAHHATVLDNHEKRLQALENRQ